MSYKLADAIELSEIVPRRATVDSIQEYGEMIRRRKIRRVYDVAEANRKRAKTIAKLKQARLNPYRLDTRRLSDDPEFESLLFDDMSDIHRDLDYQPDLHALTDARFIEEQAGSQKQALWVRYKSLTYALKCLGFCLSALNAIGAGAATYYTLHWMGIDFFGVAASGFLPYDIFCYFEFLVIAKQNQSNYGRSVERSAVSLAGCNDDELVNLTESSIPNHLEPSPKIWNVLWYTLSFLGAVIKAAMGAVGIITVLQSWIGPAALTTLLPLSLSVAALVFTGSFFCNLSQQGNELRKHKIQIAHKKGILVRTAQRLAEYSDVLLALEYTTKGDFEEVCRGGAIEVPLLLRIKKLIRDRLDKDEDWWQVKTELAENKAKQIQKIQAAQTFQLSKKLRLLNWVKTYLDLDFWDVEQKIEEAKADFQTEKCNKAEQALLATMQARDTLSYEWARLLKIKQDLGDAQNILQVGLAISDTKAVPQDKQERAHYEKGFDFDKKTATFLTLFGFKKSNFLERSTFFYFKRFAIKTFRVVFSKKTLFGLSVFLGLAAAFAAAYFCFPVMVLPAAMAVSALVGVATLFFCALVYEAVHKKSEQRLLAFDNIKDRLFELRNVGGTTVSVNNASGAGLDAWFSVVGVVALCAGMTPALAMGSPMIVGLCFLAAPVMYLMNYFMYKQKVQTLAKRHGRKYEIRKFAENSKDEKGIFGNSSSYQDNQRRAEHIVDNQPLTDVLRNSFYKWAVMRNGGFIKSLKTALGSFGTWNSIMQLVGVTIVLGVSVTQPVGIAVAISLFVCAFVVTMAQVSRRVKSSNISMSATKSSLIAMAERAPDERAVSAYKEEAIDFLDGRYSLVIGLKELIEEIKFDLGAVASNRNVDQAAFKLFFDGVLTKQIEVDFSNNDQVERCITDLIVKQKTENLLRAEKALMTQTEIDDFIGKKHDEIKATAALVQKLWVHMNNEKTRRSIDLDSDSLLKRFVDTKFIFDDEPKKAQQKTVLKNTIWTLLIKGFCEPDKLIENDDFNNDFEIYIKTGTRKKFTQKDKQSIEKHINCIKQFQQRLGEPLRAEDLETPASSTKLEPILVSMQRAKKNLRQCYDKQIFNLYADAALENDNEKTERYRVIQRTYQQRKILRRMIYKGERDFAEASACIGEGFLGKNVDQQKPVHDFHTRSSTTSRRGMFSDYTRAPGEKKPNRTTNPLLFYMLGDQEDPITISDTISDYAQRLNAQVKKHAPKSAANGSQSNFFRTSSSGSDTFTPSFLVEEVKKEYELDFTVMKEVGFGSSGRNSPTPVEF